MTGFCNEEEAGVGFADKAKWLLEDELKKLPTQPEGFHDQTLSPYDFMPPIRTFSLTSESVANGDSSSGTAATKTRRARTGRGRRH